MHSTFVSVISKGSDEKYTPKYQYLGQYIYQCQNLQPQKRRNYSNKIKNKKCGFSLISRESKNGTGMYFCC